MPLTLSLEQLRSAEDVDLGVSAWVEITQDRIDRFAAATGDHQWIHTDPQRAAQGPFGGTIAHGYLTMALLPTLAGTLLAVPDSSMAVNYGLDRLRLTAPVPVESRIRARARIARTEEKAGGVLAYVDVTVEIAEQTRPALVGTVLSLRLP